MRSGKNTKRPPNSGAKAGNQNAAKGRMVEAAIRRAILARDDKLGEGETLRMIAEKMLDMCLEGDLMAFREVADRLDGKPHQQLDATITGDLVITLSQADADA